MRGHATSLCHREIVKNEKARKLDSVLIFEDDVLFLTYDLRCLSDVIGHLKAMPSWQLFFLGMNVRSFGLKKVSKNLLFGEKGRPAKIHQRTPTRFIIRRLTVFSRTRKMVTERISTWLSELFDFFGLYPFFNVQDHCKKARMFQTHFCQRCGRFRWFFRVRSSIWRWCRRCYRRP